MRNVARFCAVLYTISLIGITISFEGVINSVIKIFGLATLGTWFLSFLETKRFQRLTATHVCMVLYFGWTVLSFFWTDYPDATYDACYRLGLMVGAMFVNYELFSDDERTAAIGTQAGVIGCLITALWIIYNWKTGNVYFGETRYTAGGLHPNTAAFVVIVGIPLAWELLRRRATPYRFLGPVNAVYPFLALFGLVLTGSRGGFLEAVPIFIWALILLFRTRGGPVALAFIFMAGTAFVATNADIQSNFSRLTDVNRLEQDKGSGRAELWPVAIRFFQENPVTGVAAGAFRWKAGSQTSLEGSTLGAHNAWLETATELGIPGVVLIGSVIFSIPLMALKAAPGRRAGLIMPWTPFPIIMFYEHIERQQFFWGIFIVLLIQTAVAMRSHQRELAIQAAENHRLRMQQRAAGQPA